jgi:GNAT superfamily N-acetyltransferase
LKLSTNRYDLKIAKALDFDNVKEMCLKFHAESIYKDKEIDDDKVETLVSEYIHLTDDRIVILGLLEGQPAGIIAGRILPLLFSEETVATETVWWVDPKHRGSRLGLQLVEAFEYWAKKVKKANLLQMSGLANTPEIDKLYQRLGYTLTEKVYLKEIK